MSENSEKKARTEVNRPHMKPRGVQAGTSGVFVGSMMGFKKYVLYTVQEGAFEPILTIGTQGDAEKMADALEMAANMGRVANTNYRGDDNG